MWPKKLNLKEKFEKKKTKIFFFFRSQASFPIAAIAISFLSINYKLFNKGDTASELIDLHIDRITPSDAQILIWFDESLKDQTFFQQSLQKVIDGENLKSKYLTYPRKLIEAGKKIEKIKNLRSKLAIIWAFFNKNSDSRTLILGTWEHHALPWVFPGRFGNLSRREYKRHRHQCFILGKFTAQFGGNAKSNQ